MNAPQPALGSIDKSGLEKPSSVTVPPLRYTRASTAVLAAMEFYWVLSLLLLIYGANPTNGRCERSLTLDHGSMVFRSRTVVRFRCNRGYTLQGNTVATCDRDGRLRGERPFCARSGCPKQEDQETGLVLNVDLKSLIVCHDGYVLVGNRFAYCDGEKWNTELGSCLRSNHTQDHSCDFESEDQCGWAAETTFRRPWKRVSSVADFHSLRTGPPHDHTFRNQSGGHYMRMETISGAFGSYHFVSPIYPRALSLKTACCFRFHYFMYGEGVDSLVVSVKPVSMPMVTMWNRFRSNSSKFEMTGSQGTEWLEHTITIDEMQEDFQVIFTATDARARFGDIAIDDVKLMTGKDCGVGEFTTTTEPPAPPTDDTDPVLVFSMMNCTGRCGQLDSKDGFILNGGSLVLGCDCDEECMVRENCCLDYLDECVAGIYTSPEDSDVTAPPTTPIPITTKATTPRTTTTSTTPTSTTKKTTTSKKPVTTTKKTSVNTTAATTPTTRTTRTTHKTTTTRKVVTTIKSTTTPRSTTTKKAITIPTTSKIPFTTTRKTPINTTAATTPTPRTTRTTPRTTTPKKVITTKETTTTPRSTTTEKVITTPTTVGNKPTAAHPLVGTTKPMKKRITWKVDPEDIAGHMDVHGSSSNPALVVLYMLICVVLVVVLGNVIHRWKIPFSDANRRKEKAVSFKRAIASLRQPGRFSRNRRNSVDQPLCDTDNEDGDYFETDGTRFEEMGVDIRNVSDL